MAGTVLVTGGSGYIAGETIRQLLARGWTVHTTVRNLAREAELRPQLGGSADRLKFFAADLTSDTGWAEAMAGSEGALNPSPRGPGKTDVAKFGTLPPRSHRTGIVGARKFTFTICPSGAFGAASSLGWSGDAGSTRSPHSRPSAR